MDRIAYPWLLLDRRLIGGANANARITGFLLPRIPLYLTFRLLIHTFAAGSVTIRLRGGFSPTDADVATFGVNFPLLGAANLSDIQSPVFAPAAAAKRSENCIESA